MYKTHNKDQNPFLTRNPQLVGEQTRSMDYREHSFNQTGELGISRNLSTYDQTGKQEQFINGLPIGQGIAGSGTINLSNPPAGQYQWYGQDTFQDNKKMLGNSSDVIN